MQICRVALILSGLVSRAVSENPNAEADVT